MDATFEGFQYGSSRFAVNRKKIATALLFIFYARFAPRYFKNDVAFGNPRRRGVWQPPVRNSLLPQL
jgi:hypothetical protein